MTTRLNNLRANIQNVKFAVAVGHGAHDSNLPPVLIPSNMYVVFLTKPGYLGLLQNTISQGWRDVFGNQNKMRQFITGNLPRNQIPTLVTKLGLDWKKHIYGPGMVIPNHILQMNDYSPTRPIIQEYDNMCGLWFPGTTTNRLYYNEIVNLQQLVTTTRFRLLGKVILFISGCRSDVTITQPAINAAKALNANGYERFVGRQNYNVPLTNYLRGIQNFEQHTGRYMTLKRHRANNGRRIRGLGAAAAGNNNSNRNNGLNARLSEINANGRSARSRAGNNININPYLRMIHHIKMNTFGKRVSRGENKMLPIAAARLTYKNFFPSNMSTENVARWINSIKRSNTNLANNISEIHKSTHEPVEASWRNSRVLAKRILHRIHNIENRRRRST
jgi:hypothetical protein